jgi:hypothetical protein
MKQDIQLHPRARFILEQAERIFKSNPDVYRVRKTGSHVWKHSFFFPDEVDETLP